MPIYLSAYIAPIIALTFIGAGIIYINYERQHVAPQAIDYTLKPKDNVLLIIKFEEDAHPYQIVYMPKIIGGNFIMLPWNHGYKSFSDAANALDDVRRELYDNKINKHFGHPRLIDQTTFNNFSIHKVDLLQKYSDWENIHWE